MQNDELKAKKEYLARYQSVQKQIKGLIREIEQWQTMAENASAATVQAPQTVSAIPTLLASIFPLLPFLMLIVSIVGGVM